jgi:hypothetical protein
MEDNDAPITKQQLTEALGRAVETIATEIKAAEERADARAQETARNMQTEILRGIEAFARGSFARMHRIETSDSDTNTRITALEERVLYLETRRQ